MNNTISFQQYLEYLISLLEIEKSRGYSDEPIDNYKRYDRLCADLEALNRTLKIIIRLSNYDGNPETKT